MTDNDQTDSALVAPPPAADVPDFASARMNGIINDLLVLAQNAPPGSPVRKLAIRAADTALPTVSRVEDRAEDVLAARSVLNDIYALLREHPEQAGARRAASWVERAVLG